MSQKHTSTTISKLHKSRKILLSILEKRGFNTDEYKNSGINEIQIMFNNKQLDMLLEDKNKNKIYIKYHIINKLREGHIYDYIEDLYNIENILNQNDELMIIMKDQKINKTLVECMNFIYEKDKIYVNIFNLKEFLFNILEHDMVPEHKRLTDDEKKNIYKKFQVTNDSELPEISRFDPVAKTIGLRPGELCEIIRPSKNSITSKYYRLCD